MALACKPLCLIQFGSCVNSLLPLSTLWEYKNWHPSLKVGDPLRKEHVRAWKIEMACPRIVRAVRTWHRAGIATASAVTVTAAAALIAESHDVVQ